MDREHCCYLQFLHADLVTAVAMEVGHAQCSLILFPLPRLNKIPCLPPQRRLQGPESSTDLLHEISLWPARGEPNKEPQGQGTAPAGIMSCRSSPLQESCALPERLARQPMSIIRDTNGGSLGAKRGLICAAIRPGRWVPSQAWLKSAVGCHAVGPGL